MDISVIKNIVRVGQVSTIDTDAMTVKVVFPDKDNLVSDNLHVLNRGSQNYKDYWLPSIGEQVLCLFLPNASGRGSSEGYILGSFFSKVDKVNANSQSVRRIDFGDGSYVEHDCSTGNMTIKATGNLKIIGAKVFINE